MHSFLEDPKSVYLSMKIAVESEIPTYSGGLSVPAGYSAVKC
jgi:hypothetical protein